MSYSGTLSSQHRECDKAFTRIERYAIRGEWENAMIAMREFVDSMNAHFQYEENELFPALERAHPMVGAGPIPVMLAEHQQMRELFDDLAQALSEHDRELLADTAQTLLFVMQQHNTKEENVLYPIADQELPPADVPKSVSVSEG